MSAFEFFFTLVSLITSLALVHLISGAVDLIRHRDRKGVSGIHLLWMAGAFFLTLGNWANFWLARNTTGWSAIQVLLAVFGLTILYAFAVLVKDVPAQFADRLGGAEFLQQMKDAH